MKTPKFTPAEAAQIDRRMQRARASSLQSDEIRYALTKQVPDMERGFTVTTSYGDITIPAGKLARHLQANMERALVRELGVLEAQTVKHGYFKIPVLTPNESAVIFNNIFRKTKAKRKSTNTPTSAQLPE